MKLVFLDIDGTLLPAGCDEPPVSALKAMERAKANGHKVFLCTGRNPSAYSFLKKYPFDGDVGSGGGYVRIGDDVIFDNPLPDAVLRNALDVMHRAGIYCVLEGLTETYAEPDYEETVLLQIDAEERSEWMQWYKNAWTRFRWQGWETYEGAPIYKLVFIGADELAIREAEKKLESDFYFCFHSAPGSRIYNGEMIPRAFDKGRGIIRVCEALGVPVEDTVAFGDSPNDLQMIQTAGIGVCMGNGHSMLKELADIVCGSVNEDGLANGFEMAGLL